MRADFIETNCIVLQPSAAHTHVHLAYASTVVPTQPDPRWRAATSPPLAAARVKRLTSRRFGGEVVVG